MSHHLAIGSAEAGTADYDKTLRQQSFAQRVLEVIGQMCST
jgi:hypothetical protein